MAAALRTARLRLSIVTTVALLAAGLFSTVGATKVTFRFRPPEDARSVTVAGSFNDWSTTANPLFDPEGDGVYEVQLEIAPGEHPYKYVVDGNRWITDLAAPKFVDDGYGGQNSVLIVTGDAPLFAGEPGGGAAVEPSGTAVTFRYRHEGGHANAVSVAGSFNDWNAAAHPMSDPDGDGIWETTIHLMPGEYAYQFVVDGDDWRGDPAARRREPDGFGGENALLTVREEPMTAGER
ncbi:MAG: isoamylase early set domain-containing protein [Candidatus Eisenbacteria bacterium]|nr:isoamylase early set domain-containing protein [Candidatus Eisenbacteria bacterium]